MVQIKKRFLAIFTLTIIISFFLGFEINRLTQPLQTNLQTSQLSENYKKVNQILMEKFKPIGYREILGDSGDVIVVPDSVAGRQDMAGGLYSREKHYTYKNIDKSVIVLVSLSSNSNQYPAHTWRHSNGYAPSIYNTKDGKFKDSFGEHLPKSEVYTYAFEANGYNICITAISDNLSDQPVYTLSLLAEFTDELAKLIEENRL